MSSYHVATRFSSSSLFQPRKFCFHFCSFFFNTNSIFENGALSSLFFFCGGEKQYEKYLKRHRKLPYFSFRYYTQDKPKSFFHAGEDFSRMGNISNATKKPYCSFRYYNRTKPKSFLPRVKTSAVWEYLPLLGGNICRPVAATRNCAVGSQ